MRALPCDELAWTPSYVGVPFVDCGRDRTGWDCLGMLLAVYREQLGVELPSFPERYESVSDGQGIQSVYAEMREAFEEIPFGSVGDICVRGQPFDVLWAQVAGNECHVLVYAGRHQALHSFWSAGTQLVRIDRNPWRWRIRAWHRLKT